MVNSPGDLPGYKAQTPPAELRARRRRTGSAATAYAHAALMTGSPKTAEQIAVSALRKGAHSRTSIIAHSRYLSLRQAIGSLETEPGSDPRSIALYLARTRPPIELCLIDLGARYGLDQGTFSRVLGISAASAKNRLKEAKEAWGEQLDPIMMSALGPGPCTELAALLSPTLDEPSSELQSSDTEPKSEPDFGLADLVKIAPSLRSHIAACQVCSPRLKALTPVSTLVGQTPVEPVPSLVSAVAMNSRKRLPTAIALPPSIDSSRIDLRRFRSATAIALAVLLGVAGLWLGGNAVSGGESQSKRVDRLISEAPRSSLLATPSKIGPDNTTITLANNSDVVVLWSASTSAPWLQISPTSGRIEPNSTVSMEVVSQPPPDLGAYGSISISGSDGSSQTIKFETE